MGDLELIIARLGVTAAKHNFTAVRIINNGSLRLLIDLEEILLRYFQVQDYALWDVIENGNSFKPVPQTTTNVDGSLTLVIPGLVTTEEKVQKKSDVKARKVAFLSCNTHVVDCWNKPDLDTSDLMMNTNNYMIVEQEVKRIASSSSSLSSQNMAFVSSPSSTNEVNNGLWCSLANTQTKHVSSMYRDLKQIHEDDIEEMDLKWQLALLSMRTRRNPEALEGCKCERNLLLKAMEAIDGAGFF
ncbi:hypothetical protein Tco_0698412 [Tanacetum coccineum]